MTGNGFEIEVIPDVDHFLTMEGGIEHNLYLIEDGAVKIYYQSELGEHMSDVMHIIENSQGYRVFLEAVLIQQLDREIDLLLHSPQQRLERVLKRSPHLFQHIPLKYIASYLRMSPETLSRIRKS